MSTGHSLSAAALEGALQSAWCRTLHLEHVDVHDNFFDIGGDSFRIRQVQALLQDELSLDVPTTELFEYPTIRALARHLVGAGSDDASDRVAERAHRRIDAFVAQRRRRSTPGAEHEG
ncbi:MAG: phosphopantetheine-binding protein [Vicinamibacterales bacterium]